MNPKGTAKNLVAAHPRNTNAVRAGVYSPRTLAPRGREVADSLLEAPQAVPLDQIAAEEIGSLVALLEATTSNLANGESPIGTATCGRFWTIGFGSGRLERWLRRFGATPSSRMSGRVPWRAAKRWRPSCEPSSPAGVRSGNKQPSVETSAAGSNGRRSMATDACSETGDRGALDLMSTLVLEDGRLWGEAATDFQWADASANLDESSERPYSFQTRPRGG